MKIEGKVIVVTGGAHGIGEALCRRFASEKARGVVAADIDADGAKLVASEIGGLGIRADVKIESDIINLVNETEMRYGPIDLFCSNAGILSFDGPDGSAASAADDTWRQSWEIHVMAHVYAARALLPGMIKRKSGYFLNTASAAGLLNLIGSAPYSVTKHAAIAFAESLAITHGDDGIGVSVLCPQAVMTSMLAGNEDGPASMDGVISPEAVAECVVRGLEEEKFLILPHGRVKEYIDAKAGDYDRWIKGMRKMRRGMPEAKNRQSKI